MGPSFRYEASLFHPHRRSIPALLQAKSRLSTPCKHLNSNPSSLPHPTSANKPSPPPPDNLGAILAASSIFARTHNLPITLRTILTALIKTYEIQGVFQIANAFNKVGLDHVILVKVASTAVVSWLIGLPRAQALAAVSHAWLDGHPLRAYRQA